MAEKKHVHVAPQYLTWRHVHADLGTGRVCLYDARIGMPDVVPAPPDPTMFEKTWWVLVHFPSRRWCCVKSKKKALGILDEIHKGQKNSLLLIPQKEEKAQVCAPAPARQETGPSIPDQSPAQEEAGEASQEFKATVVPEGLNFDKAFQFVFPVQRLTANLERLLVASNPIYDKEGRYCGEAPNYQAQIQAQKMAMEYHQGRPDVKPPTKEEKQPLTLQELRAKMVMSDEYRAGILEMVQDCAKEAASKKDKKP